MIRSIRHISDQVTLGIWEITEPIEQLEALSPTDEDISHYHPKKKAEYLASRHLIQEMCQQLGIPFPGIWKDEHGKPHFIDSEVQLSISHSHPVIACMIHTTQSCGIDIESPRSQLINIKRKFLSEREQTICGDDLEQLCLYWAAKEAIFKMFGRKYLSFSRDISIEKVLDQGLEVVVDHEGQRDEVTLVVEKMDQYLMVYGNI